MTSTDPNNWNVVEATIIDANDSDANALTFNSSENQYSVLKGFTITGAARGIYCEGSSPMISHCIIRDNDTNGLGGGMYNIESSPTISNCFFSGNSADYGGGIYDVNSSPLITNCVFNGNIADVNGGAIYNNGSSITLANCTIYGNDSVDGAGVYNYASTAFISNCIIWGNNTSSDGNSIYNYISYSDIEGCGGSGGGWDAKFGIDGGGNKDIDPSFVANDYHLQYNSPCVDAGDPNGSYTGQTDIDNSPRVVGSSVDIGADELNGAIYVKSTANPGGNGSSWVAAFKYLQDALTIAKSGDQIWVAAGTYKPGTGSRNTTFQLKEGVRIYGGFAGGETLLDKRDLVLNKTILSGDIDENDYVDGSVNGLPAGQNSYHVVTGANGAVLDGVTITHGLADGTGNDGYGGGLYCNGTSPIVNACTFVLNKAKDHGAAIYTNNAFSATFSNCLINGNWTNGNGGTIFSTNGAANSNVKIVNCTIANNSGDGIHCDSTIVSIQNSILWQNRTASDYPVRELCLAGTANATVNYCNIDGGQTEVKQTGSPTLVWGSGNIIPAAPTFVQWGAWDWRLIDGNDLEAGLTATPVDLNEVTIYDFTAQFADMEKGNEHNEDDFIADMLDTNPASPTYKKPVWDPNSGDKDTLSNVTNFNLWFSSDSNGTKSGAINSNIQVPSWICADAGKGVFKFDSEHFFPIDDCTNCFGLNASPKNKYLCTICSDEPNEVYHNWFFTVQYHTKCMYIPGQRLHFKSSDDLFVAINDMVIVNRGGYFVDCEVETEVVLENGNATVYKYTCGDPNRVLMGTETFPFGLQPDTTYDFDVFYAQRHTYLSALVMERSLPDSQMASFFINGDYRLQAGSSGIDAGDNEAVPSYAEQDFGSYPRFYNDLATPDTGHGAPPIVDIGGWEYRGNEAPVVEAGGIQRNYSACKYHRFGKLFCRR